MATARAAESAGYDPASRQHALDLYNQIVTMYGDTLPAVEDAADAVLRLEIAKVPKPLRLPDIALAHAIFKKFEAFPPGVKDRVAEKMAAQLIEWARDLEGLNQSAVLQEKIALLDNALSTVAYSTHTEASKLKSEAVLKREQQLESSSPLDAVHPSRVRIP
jgi:hypothetical protein